MRHHSGMDKKTFLAACAVALPEGGQLVKIIPKGTFAPTDGRTDHGVPAWTLNAQLAAQMMADLSAKATDVVVDYEHASLKAAENGTPNPAAGWISRYEWDDQQGLMAEIKWTEKAAQMIAEKAYRYLSPVLLYNAAGEVKGLHSVALTNTPALDGMALAALSKQLFLPTQTTTEETLMDKEVLIKLLGLAADADEAAINAALAAWQEKTGGKSLDELLAARQEDKPEDQPAPAADPPKDGDKPAAAEGKTEIDELKEQMAALSQKMTAIEVGNTSDGLIAAALSDGRLLPHQKESAEKLAKADPAAFKAMMDGSLKLAALSQTQTGGKGGGQSAVTLSAEEMAVAKQLGITPEDYQKAK